MSSYERALSGARRTPVIVPEFEAIAEACETERARWADEDRDHRERARRWFLVAAVVWLAYPLLYAFLPDAFLPHPTDTTLVNAAAFSMPMVPVLLWAADMSRDRRVRANILTRAIAASNIVLVLMSATSEGNADCVLAILVAVAMGRTLQLLGVRGLDGSDDPGSEFDPVKFRGVLLLTLLLACTDAVTLLWCLIVSVGLDAASVDEAWRSYLPNIVTTAVALVLIPINVWGVLRLRTWALFSSMLTNIVIGVLAMTSMLSVGWGTEIALVTTAVIQLLLPLPILAAALGLDSSHRYAWVALGLLRVVVPVFVLITIGIAVAHLRWSFPAPW